MILYNIEYRDSSDYYGCPNIVASFDTEQERDDAFEYLMNWWYNAVINTEERKKALEENWQWEYHPYDTFNRHNAVVRSIQEYKSVIDSYSKTETHTSTLEELIEHTKSTYMHIPSEEKAEADFYWLQEMRKSRT